MTSNLYNQCLQLCSRHYLCYNYPDSWFDLNYDNQLEFIADNLWEPMENELPELVRGAIESAAKVTYEFIEAPNK